MSIPSLFARLVDDAAMFPPGNAPITAAVEAHAGAGGHRHAWYAELVGPLVVSDRWLPELSEALAGQSPDVDPLPVILVVSGGAGALEPALTWAGREPALEVASVEIAARDDDASPGGLAHNVTRITTALAAAPVAVPAHVELPRPRSPGPAHEPAPDWLRALDVLAAADVAVKVRTGGESQQAHPSAAELVACIDAALDRELSFKATAGLHHAVRHTAAQGWEQHGFLNLLVATETLLAGGGRDAAVATLADRDPTPLVDAVRGWPVDPQPAVRRWFTSFGSCSVTDPVDDLVALGLLDRPRSDPEPQ